MATSKLDNVLIIENALSENECDAIITEYSVDLKTDKVDTHLGYEYNDILEGNPIVTALVSKAFAEYIKTYPTINQTNDKWQLNTFRFKRFPPNHSFNNWHAEHEVLHPYRILCCMVYLSNHNCGTEFYATNETVLSKKGRLIMFPAFWTHTHRGQVCPDKKDRYIMNAYVEFVL